MMDDKTTGLSQLEIDELTELFNLVDADADGKVSIDSIAQVLQALKADDTDNTQKYPLMEKLESQLVKAKWNDTTDLDLDAFLQLFESTSLQQILQQQQENQQENFGHVFRLFDTQDKGYITIQDLERVAKELGEHDITQQELQEMMDRAHAQHRERVNLQEFTKLMTMNLFHKDEELAE
jgi:Ca2+-binding EF-hand superfamily protein